ncbi:hypothetical protein LSAT2_009208 [Lamellibrachia satsuma]|nr:hypothetical protein LSAT2_009208 [Lamellibrachia satsuma]
MLIRFRLSVLSYKGSGGAAEILAHAYTENEERSDELKLQESLKQLIKKEFPQLKDNIEEMVTLVMECVGKCDLMTVKQLDSFDEATQMDMVILNAILQGTPHDTPFYGKLMAKVYDDRNHSLIDIGSCGLHVVHSAFKAGFEATSWDVKPFLWALYTIFYETPARREDYTAITSSVVFPLKFYLHRWVENATVAARALIFLPHLKKYVDTIQQNLKMHAVSTSKLSTIVKSGCTDVLMPARLMFFRVCGTSV